MELIHSRLHTKAVVLVHRAVQVHTNQEKMEDDDLNGRSHSGLQRYEDNHAPIKHRKRCKKASLKFSPSRWVQATHSSASPTGGKFQRPRLTERFEFRLKCLRDEQVSAPPALRFPSPPSKVHRWKCQRLNSQWFPSRHDAVQTICWEVMFSPDALSSVWVQAISVSWRFGFMRVGAKKGQKKRWGRVLMTGTEVQTDLSLPH